MTTLGYIETRESYLMLHRVKKEQDVNEGKWIGIGGKFEYGESPEECMIREAKEETGLAVTSMKFRGILTFICDKQDPEYICLYTIDGFSGQLKECDEGELLWVPKDEIFGLNLWEGDRIFFDLLQKDVPFFSLKLCYEGDQLLEAVLNGEKELVRTAKV
jgi:8-oxo-dGTP diphosphatase